MAKEKLNKECELEKVLKLGKQYRCESIEYGDIKVVFSAFAHIPEDSTPKKTQQEAMDEERELRYYSSSMKRGI